MHNEISLEQVEAIAEHCRKMRSEAVYDAFTSLFSSLGEGISKFFGPGKKYDEPALSALAGSLPKKSSFMDINTGYSWRQVTAD